MTEQIQELDRESEDPGFWDNLDLESIGAVMLALPEPEAKRIAAAQLRARGYTGLITATSVYPEESADIAAAGADLTFNYYDEVGVGFAEHVWEAMYPEPEDATSVVSFVSFVVLNEARRRDGLASLNGAVSSSREQRG